ncbi:MAG: filamentous hemagglutinin N-terminal domain-containing protein, partial [Opitutales bacterium]
MKPFLLSFCTLLAASSLSVELPSGASVSAGSAAVSASGSVMTVDQSTARAVLNWQSFSVGEGASVIFRQPDASSVTLNRVVGGDASRIAGSVTANGSFFLVNPNGVLFAPGAQVSAASIVASTLATADADFMAGRFILDGAGPGLVVNRGNLTAVGDGRGGLVALVAARVINEGSVGATAGAVALAAADPVPVALGGRVGVS